MGLHQRAAVRAWGVTTLAKRGEIVGAIDFGSRAIRVLIARKGSDGGIQIAGHGSAPSKGCISQGVIQDFGATQLALKRAIQNAEKEAGVKVDSFFCGINGKNVATHIRDGQVQITQQVTPADLQEALDVASRDILAPGKRLLSSITSQEWYVDDLRVTDPPGIRGSILRARVHLAEIPQVIEENLTTCIESLKREVEDIVFLPLANGLGCLTAEDMDLGVAVLDMGRATTGLAVYRDRRIHATHTFEWGGFDITRDVAAGLQISFEEASELIMAYGISPKLIETVDPDGESGPVKASQDKNEGGGASRTAEKASPIKLKTAVHGAESIVERDHLDMIVFERCMELATKVRQFLESRNQAKHLVRGMVLSGGAATIANQTRLCERVFSVPVRLGLPQGIDILPQPVNTPEYVPVVGVVRHGFDYRAAVESGRIENQRGPVGRFFAGVGKVFSDFFF